MSPRHGTYGDTLNLTPHETPHESRQSVAALLTPRQLEVARLFAAGLTNRQVAERVCITPRTARDHLEEIHLRLSVHSRAELTTLLVREGLV